MPKDSRYRNAQKLILGGLIKNVSDLFDAVAKTSMAREIGTSAARMSKLINQPELFTFEDCIKIAAVLEVDQDKIIDLIREELRKRKGRKK